MMQARIAGDGVVPSLSDEKTYKRPEDLAALAVQVLQDEAMLTPKPGLVDGRGSGVHHDLTLGLLLRSAKGLEPGFLAMARAAEGRPASVSLRETLGQLGRETERCMLAVTHGVNTHRGAIWALGLLISGAASAQPDSQTTRIVRTAAALARLPDRFAPAGTSHGLEAGRRFGVGGAREEAARGFPHVLGFGLPTLWASRERGAKEDEARLNSLLALMSMLPDTCLLHRGGASALRTAQHGACAVLTAGGMSSPAGRRAMSALDRALLQAWLSPGGSADLLAATLFLDALEKPKQGRERTHDARYTA